jgi:hypothetical protein
LLYNKIAPPLYEVERGLGGEYMVFREGNRGGEYVQF